MGLRLRESIPQIFNSDRRDRENLAWPTPSPARPRANCGCNFDTVFAEGTPLKYNFSGRRYGKITVVLTTIRFTCGWALQNLHNPPPVESNAGFVRRIGERIELLGSEVEKPLWNVLRCLGMDVVPAMTAVRADNLSSR